MRIRRYLPVVFLLVGTLALVFYLYAGLDRGNVAGVVAVAPSSISYLVAFGSFLPLGAFIATRRPENPIGWIMCSIGLSVLLAEATIEYALRGLLVEPGSLPAPAAAAWLSSIVGIPAIGFLSFLMLLFPTGHLVSRGWRWVARLVALDLVVLLTAIILLWPARGLRLVTAEEAPAGYVPAFLLEGAWIGMILGGMAGMVSLVVRFRRSSGVERQQLKAMAFVAAVVACLVFSEIFVLEWLGVVDRDVREITETLLNLAVAGIPVAAAVSILRYRLYDIDLLINRTLVYGSLTALLAGAYVGLVFLFQVALAPFTAESDLAIAASTLAVAGLFRPVRSRVQDFIDRRFYRRRFDVQRTLEDFTGQLRDEVDLVALSSRLTAVVGKTMQPAHVSLWVKGAGWSDPVTISERRGTTKGRT